MAGNQDPAKIVSLQVKNTCKIKAFSSRFEDGLNVIGGENQQGKTTILKIMQWLIQGGRAKPSNPKRDGSVNDPEAELILTNGCRVQMNGKNNTIKVTDPSGKTGGVTLLKNMFSDFALDIPSFMNVSSTEKVKRILKEKGVDEAYSKILQEETKVYNDRTAIGRIADEKKKYAGGLEYDDAAGDQLKSVQEILNKKSEILSRNNENQRARNDLENLKGKSVSIAESINHKSQQIQELQKQLAELEQQKTQVDQSIAGAMNDVAELQDQDTAELESEIENIEVFNSRVRKNLEYVKASDEAKEYKSQYDGLTERLEQVRKQKTALLDGLNMSLSGLEIVDGDLIYNGQRWDGMSGSEQIMVSVAVAKAINPNVGFVLLDKLEQMDKRTLKQFGDWVRENGLQVIAVRVSDGDECQIIIEDGGIAKTSLPEIQDYSTTNNSPVEEEPEDEEDF